MALNLLFYYLLFVLPVLCSPFSPFLPSFDYFQLCSFFLPFSLPGVYSFAIHLMVPKFIFDFFYFLLDNAEPFRIP